MKQTFYKRANGSAKKALDELLGRYPDASHIEFNVKTATKETAPLARVKVGEKIFEATVHVGEFGEEEGGDEGEEPKSEPKPKKKEEGSDPDLDGDSDGDDDGDGDGPPSFGDDGDGLGAPKMKPEEQMVHLLTQILHALQGGGAPHGAPGPDLMGGPPPPKPPMGAPKPPGPGGPPGAGGPPPPVAPKAPMAGPAFSHYNPDQSEIVTIRRGATEVGNKALIAEAAEAFPTHKVAKIQRTGSARLNGKQYNLPENKIAVVTLVRK